MYTDEKPQSEGLPIYKLRQNRMKYVTKDHLLKDMHTKNIKSLEENTLTKRLFNPPSRMASEELV